MRGLLRVSIVGLVVFGFGSLAWAQPCIKCSQPNHTETAMLAQKDEATVQWYGGIPHTKVDPGTLSAIWLEKRASNAHEGEYEHAQATYDAFSEYYSEHGDPGGVIEDHLVNGMEKMYAAGSKLEDCEEVLNSGEMSWLEGEVAEDEADGEEGENMNEAFHSYDDAGDDFYFSKNRANESRVFSVSAHGYDDPPVSRLLGADILMGFDAGCSGPE